MFAHSTIHKIMKSILIGITLLLAVLFLVPSRVAASSYRQQFTKYGISVTKVWEDGTTPEPVTITVSYTASFRLFYNGSDTLPESIQVKYGGEDCGTAYPLGQTEYQTDNSVVSIRQYAVDPTIPLHFSGTSSQETISLDLGQFTFSVNGVELSEQQDGFFYLGDNYGIECRDLLDDYEATADAVIDETSESGRDYLITSSCDKEDVDTRDTIIHTRDFTVTNSIAKIDLSATKTVNNNTPDQSYTFNLLDEDGNVLQTSQNDADGNIQFDTIYYGASAIDHEYTYRVKEVEGSDQNTTYDSTVYTVKVNVYKDPENSAVVKADAVITKDGQEVSGMTFDNETKTSLILTARKTVNSRTPVPSYTFQLLDANGKVLQTSQNDADGNIQFDAISYSADDIGKEYTYRVKEEAGNDKNTTYDSSVYTVTVTPALDPNAASQIIVDPVITKNDEEVSEMTFNNETKTSLTLTATKTVNNATPVPSYTFVLLDADGNILQTRQNDADGNIQFDAISYSADDIGKEYTYQVKEKAGADGNTTYDSSVYTITVTPSLDPDDASKMIVDPVITKENKEVSAITFNNETTTSLVLTAKKTVNNGKPGESYTFYLMDADGNILQTRQNDADGNIQFDAISYTSSDVGKEYTYQVKEEAGSDENTTYDSSVYTVKVTLSLNPEDASEIIVASAITKGDKEVAEIAFNNTTSKPAATPLTAQNVTGNSVPETGDPSEPVLWFVLIAASAAVLCIIGIRMRRKKEK